jgi:lysophospholipase L1-like esterase
MKFMTLLILALSMIGCGKSDNGVNTQNCNYVSVKLYGTAGLSFWGDSITQGQTGGASSFETAFNVLMANDLGMTDENMGYSGSQLTDVCEYNAIMNWQYSGKGAINIWLVGFNDATFSGTDPGHLQTFQQDMTQAIIHLTQNGGRVFVGTTLNVPDNFVLGFHSKATVQTYVALETQVVTSLQAQGLAVYLVDTTDAYDANTMVSSDNTHPADAGHVAISQAFETSMKNNL